MWLWDRLEVPVMPTALYLLPGVPVLIPAAVAPEHMEIGLQWAAVVMAGLMARAVKVRYFPG